MPVFFIGKDLPHIHKCAIYDEKYLSMTILINLGMITNDNIIKKG